MTYTRAIGLGCNKVIRLIVRALALSKIHPNVLTFLGLLINVVAAVLLARGSFSIAGIVIISAGLFDMVDGRVARETNQVTRFGRMAPVLLVIALPSNITVIHRMIFTYQEAKRLEDAQLRPVPARERSSF